MIRTLIVADSGDVMRGITSTLLRIEAVEIAAYASGRTSIDRIVRSVRPDLVLIDEMSWLGLALARISEAREAHPACAVLGLSARAEASWVVQGVPAGAASVVPRDLEPATLGRIIDDVLGRTPPAVRARTLTLGDAA